MAGRKMSAETSKRLKILERGYGRQEQMARQIKELDAAHAEMCAGQLSQDEIIASLMRRLQELEAERVMRKSSANLGNGGV
jgi:hypothetical protein